MSLTYTELTNNAEPRWRFNKYCVSEQCLPQGWPIVDKVLRNTETDRYPHCTQKLIYFKIQSSENQLRITRSHHQKNWKNKKVTT